MCCLDIYATTIKIAKLSLSIKNTSRSHNYCILVGEQKGKRKVEQFIKKSTIVEQREEMTYVR
jgi:hypothetical protein